MSDSKLTQEEQQALLSLARQALQAAVNVQPSPHLDYSSLPLVFAEPGATFVTLTRFGQLRGCIGALEPYQPLAADVCEHAAAAALQDYRFRPVQLEELPDIRIEISRLTTPSPVSYLDPQDLLRQLRPGLDGVVLREGFRRATFLPQVWEKIPDSEEFLSHLCNKMGALPDLWRKKKLEVLVYQVEEFQEAA